MKNIKIHPRIINIIAELYQGDRTNLILNGVTRGIVEIGSGIKQGCNLSALLFVVLMNCIIEKILGIGCGFEDENFVIPALCYMDDALLLAQSREKAIQLLRVFRETSSNCGLELNPKKCKIMVVNDKKKEPPINEMEHVNQFVYLGIKINQGMKWYREQIKDMVKKAERMVNMLYSVMGRSCNRLLIGKTYWKGMALPNFMYGQEVITFTKSTLDQFQIVENRAYRMILQLPRYTPVEFLRGEIGATTFKYRDIKNKLLYLQSILKSENNKLLKKMVIEDMEEEGTIWIKTVKSYLNNMALRTDDLLIMTANQLRSVIDKKDSSEWREAMIEKSSLNIYRKFKTEIEEVKYFRNGFKWELMINARANTLKLGWRDWGLEEEKICKMCRGGIEDLRHFLLECPKLEPIRNKYLELQRPRMEDELDIIGIILLLKGKPNYLQTQKYLDMIWDIWRQRTKICEQLENNTDS